jgi:hypothetical protein
MANQRRPVVLTRLEDRDDARIMEPREGLNLDLELLEEPLLRSGSTEGGAWST